MGRNSLEDIILRAAQLLGVDADTLNETEAREALRDNVMRTENGRIRKAIEDVTKTHNL
jgi:hypothetical protein|tara:strand:+ start:301 stop:477 length:177 start_codon:yes stop_codon:yes gene_type:complete